MKNVCSVKFEFYFCKTNIEKSYNYRLQDGNNVCTKTLALGLIHTIHKCDAILFSLPMFIVFYAS